METGTKIEVLVGETRDSSNKIEYYTRTFFTGLAAFSISEFIYILYYFRLWFTSLFKIFNLLFCSLTSKYYYYSLYSVR